MFIAFEQHLLIIEFVSYLFKDDENILKKGTMKNIDHVFQDAIIEAAQAHNAYILDKDKNDAIVSKQSSTVSY